MQNTAMETRTTSSSPATELMTTVMIIWASAEVDSSGGERELVSFEVIDDAFMAANNNCVR